MKKRLQKIRLAIGKFFLDKASTLASIKTQSPKIIVLQQDGKIGDYIVSSFIFRELRRQYPKAQLDVVCSQGNLDLFRANPFINQVYTVNRKQVCTYVKAGKLLAKNHYDYLINLPVLLRNRDLLLTRLINAKVNVAYQKPHYHIFNHSINEDKLHFSDIYERAIAFCGVKDIDATYDVPFSENSNRKVAEFIQYNQLENAIAINFFGAANSRKFTFENIHLFLNTMRQKFPKKKIILLTYPAVTAALQKIAKDFDNVFVYAETQNIFDTIAIISHCQTVISPDTSIVHIASGLGKDVIAFYQQDNLSNLTQWHPNSEKAHLLYFKNNVNEVHADLIKDNWIN